MTMLTLTTGSVFIMWLGEQITERGVGNGMSLLIFAGIVVGLPRAVVDLYGKGSHPGMGRVHRPGDPDPDRRHDRGGRVHRLCGTKRTANSGAVCQACGGPQGHGRTVDPPAVARELRWRYAGDLRVVGTDLAADAGRDAGLKNNRYFSDMFAALRWGEPLYTLLYAVGIIFFAYFYVSIVFNPTEVADNMRKYGGFIPGIRPGARTANYINDILTRITLVGALYLILISFIPEWMITGIHLNHLWGPVGRVLRAPAGMDHQRFERELLLRRNFAADRGWRGHGYGQPDRVATDHAPLRRLYAAQRTHSRTPGDVVKQLSVVGGQLPRLITQATS